MSKLRVAIIIQRFSEGINGGAEVHALQIAKMLSSSYQVTILTSCAADYKTWDNTYLPGTSEEDGLEIIRFKCQEREKRGVLKYWRRRASGKSMLQRVFQFIGSPKMISGYFPKVKINAEDGIKWLENQGPTMPHLLDYLETNTEKYAAFIFFTLLYYPTALGMSKVANKALLIPTLHDEKAMYMPIYKELISKASWIFFNTKVEKELANRIFSIQHIQQRIVGVGMELYGSPIGNNISFSCKLQPAYPYVVYVGRIEELKGCKILIEYFVKFKSRNSKSNLKLVLVGKNEMKQYHHPDIIYTGFVDDNADKISLIQHSKALIMPSFFESLSLVLLESFACQVPVLANGNTPVLKDHIERSNGGFVYCNFVDFEKRLNMLNSDDVFRKHLGENGYQYVKTNYSWDAVLNTYNEAIIDIQHQSSFK